MFLITVVKITIVACTFVGNLFVIIAILIDKNLQTPANQLVLSLAVADLMVGCLVMPLGTYNDFHDGWWLGKEVCEFWTSADVLCCTGGYNLDEEDLKFKDSLVVKCCHLTDHSHKLLINLAKLLT